MQITFKAVWTKSGDRIGIDQILVAPSPPPPPLTTTSPPPPPTSTPPKPPPPQPLPSTSSHLTTTRCHSGTYINRVL